MIDFHIARLIFKWCYDALPSITDLNIFVQHFKKCGPIHEVSVAKKRDPNDPRRLISLGYGFVQFKKRASAEKALKTLQQSVLNEHAMELKRSNRTVKYVHLTEWLLVTCSLQAVHEVNNGDMLSVLHSVTFEIYTKNWLDNLILVLMSLIRPELYVNLKLNIIIFPEMSSYNKQYVYNIVGSD
jgi:RNA recognition motif-containing protein